MNNVKKIPVKLVTAYFYRPSGRTIQNLGVTPHICIENDTHNHKDGNKDEKPPDHSSCPDVIRVNADYRHDIDRKLASELIMNKAGYRKAINDTPRPGS